MPLAKAYLAEFHSQTAVEAAKLIHADLKEQGKSAEDIESITIRTHEACIRIIDKQHKPMDNFADRDHCIQVWFPLSYQPDSQCRAKCAKGAKEPSNCLVGGLYSTYR